MAGAVLTLSSNYEDNDNTDATGSAGAMGLVYAAIAVPLFEITVILFILTKILYHVNALYEAIQIQQNNNKKYKFAFMILSTQKLRYFSCCEDFFNLHNYNVQS